MAWNPTVTSTDRSRPDPDGRPEPGPARAEPATLLIVDDEPGIVDFVQLGLGHEGYATLSASDAASGLATLRARRPQLVILDVGLPDGDGFDLLRRIRAETDVPVIMLTARGELDDRVRGLELGRMTTSPSPSTSRSCSPASAPTSADSTSPRIRTPRSAMPT